jgi:hypothetical protein
MRSNARSMSRVGVVGRQLQLQLHRCRASTPTTPMARGTGGTVVDFLCSCKDPTHRVASYWAVISPKLGSRHQHQERRPPHVCCHAKDTRATAQVWKNLGLNLSSSALSRHPANNCAHRLSYQCLSWTRLPSPVSRVPAVPGRCVVPLVPAVVADGQP